jgi:hypothetical protein
VKHLILLFLQAYQFILCFRFRLLVLVLVLHLLEA